VVYRFRFILWHCRRIPVLMMSPLILTNWFKSKTGFAVGVAWHFPAWAGFVMNPVGSVLMINLAGEPLI
jgi:hypothetical protein